MGSFTLGKNKGGEVPTFTIRVKNTPAARGDFGTRGCLCPSEGGWGRQWGRYSNTSILSLSPLLAVGGLCEWSRADSTEHLTLPSTRRGAARRHQWNCIATVVGKVREGP